VRRAGLAALVVVGIPTLGVAAPARTAKLTYGRGAAAADCPDVDVIRAFTEFILPSVVANPAHITAGPDGALWFAEEYGNRIGRLVP
jgi:streptogramin lyase